MKKRDIGKKLSILFASLFLFFIINLLYIIIVLGLGIMNGMSGLYILYIVL